MGNFNGEFTGSPRINPEHSKPALPLPISLSLCLSPSPSPCLSPVFSPRAGGCYVNSDSAHYQLLRLELELTGFGPSRGQLDPTGTMGSVCVCVCWELITKHSFISKSHPRPLYITEALICNVQWHVPLILMLCHKLLHTSADDSILPAKTFCLDVYRCSRAVFLFYHLTKIIIWSKFFSFCLRLV